MSGACIWQVLNVNLTWLVALMLSFQQLMALQQKFLCVCQYIRYQCQVSSQLLPGRQQRTVKKENKLACQNINQKKNDSAKQGELVVIKRRYRITRWKSFCDRDLLKRGVLCLPSIRLITQHRRRIARLCMLYKTLNN